MSDGISPADEPPVEAQFEAIQGAIRQGVRAEAAPIGRHLAEVRGLGARTIRHLERIEGTIAAERSARIDDLAVLVELISASWRSVDRRLQRVEEALAARDRFVPVELIGELLGGDEQDTLPDRRADAA